MPHAPGSKEAPKLLASTAEVVKPQECSTAWSERSFRLLTIGAMSAPAAIDAYQLALPSAVLQQAAWLEWKALISLNAANTKYPLLKTVGFMAMRRAVWNMLPP
eukprot:4357403-Lingulodinium_polyedra.AAC.1